jgi:hypothetical protein
MVEGDELEVGKIVGRRTVDGVEMGIAEYTHYYPAAAIGTKTFGNDPQDDEGLWMQYGRQTHAPVANITQPVDHHGMSDAEWAEHVLSM